VLSVGHRYRAPRSLALDGNRSGSGTLVTLGSEDLVVVVTKVHAILRPSVEVVLFPAY
jgi:hypothetical protein